MTSAHQNACACATDTYSQIVPMDGGTKQYLPPGRLAITWAVFSTTQEIATSGNIFCYFQLDSMSCYHDKTQHLQFLPLRRLHLELL